MQKENKQTEFGSKLVKRAEAVRDFYHGVDTKKVRVKTVQKLEFVARKSYSAKQVKKIREDVGLTQQGLADLLGTSVDTVRKWEQDSSAPTGPALRILQMIEREGIPASLISKMA
jgi:putative transcriptional regulator